MDSITYPISRQNPKTALKVLGAETKAVEILNTCMVTRNHAKTIITFFIVIKNHNLY